MCYIFTAVTCSDPETFSNAQKNPEKYDLIRVRTGGWGEFFITFFTAHQKHMERRLYYHVAWSSIRRYRLFEIWNKEFAY